jgi:nicotinic acid mononucleotide adenylyltransferase
LHYCNPEKIILIPSGKRDDKSYHVSDEHRLAMLEIFVTEIEKVEGIEKTEKTEKTEKGRVVIDDYFIRDWTGEMITRDVDIYARERYGEDIVHVFGTDTIESMGEWDAEGYAARVIHKLFVPRNNTNTVASSVGESIP